MPMGSQYQQISNQNTTPSQRPYIPTNTQLDRRTNRTQLNHKTQQETGTVWSGYFGSASSSAFVVPALFACFVSFAFLGTWYDVHSVFGQSVGYKICEWNQLFDKYQIQICVWLVHMV
jgi:hypothetical protein